MFIGGIITSRGFLDVRIEKNDSMPGEVRIENLNPKNVVIDPDGEDYGQAPGRGLHDPWVTADDIAVLYTKADAEILRNREPSFFPFSC